VNEYDSCRTKLEELIEWYTPRVGNRNEATTRLTMIDRIFFECLAWPRDSAIAEEPHGREYADYAFHHPRRVLIVEAKREGDYFELPAGQENLEYSLCSLLRDYPNLKAAIEQAAGYAQSRGTPFAVVTNGHQIVAFVATRSDGIPPLEGTALVFPSLSFMLKHFLDLWQVLSAPGVRQQRLHARLVGAGTLELPPKLSASIPGYPGLKRRNIFQTDLQVLSELVLEDISRSPDLEDQFLEECYYQSGTLSQHSLTSKAILSARYEAMFDASSPGPTTVPAADKKGIAPDLLAESLSRRPVLLIGDVGVGKTMFIRRLLKVDAADVFENAIAIYIDLGTKATLIPTLADAVLDEITRQLLDIYDVDIHERNFVHGVYHSEILRFRRGIHSDIKESNPDLFREKEVAFLEAQSQDRQEHLRRCIDHISRARKQQVVIFLDNADQRDDPIQQEAFLIAQDLAANWPAAVFVTLRPETFHHSRRKGALSGYHPKAFTIAPPRVDRVIKKRLQFAQKLATGQIPLPRLHADVKLNNLRSILAALESSLERNDDLVECIDNIAGGNVRQALDLVREFLGSGHVDTQKIVTIYDETGDYTVPVHEFLRAVIFQDAEHYDPEASPVGNLFDMASADPKEHFALPMLLGILDTLASGRGEAGFVTAAKVFEELQSCGFTPAQVNAAILRGYRIGLIETSGRREPEADTVLAALRVTTVGLYHIARLCRMFAYIDAITVDLPVCDSSVRDGISDVRRISERVQRAESVRDYLDRQWLEVGGLCGSFDWKKVSFDLKDDIEKVRTRIGEYRHQEESDES